MFLGQHLAQHITFDQKSNLCLDRQYLEILTTIWLTTSPIAFIPYYTVWNIISLYSTLSYNPHLITNYFTKLYSIQACTFYLPNNPISWYSISIAYLKYPMLYKYFITVSTHTNNFIFLLILTNVWHSCKSWIHSQNPSILWTPVTLHQSNLTACRPEDGDLNFPKHVFSQVLLFTVMCDSNKITGLLTDWYVLIWLDQKESITHSRAAAKLDFSCLFIQKKKKTLAYFPIIIYIYIINKTTNMLCTKSVYKQ